jgi:hypothetical protein
MHVAMYVESGAVARVVVRGSALDALKIRREAKIARRFGKPAGHVNELRWRIAQYPERDFCVAWHVEENRLEHVRLGGVSGWSEPRLGARELLELLLEAWNGLEKYGFEQPPSGQPPLHHRYLRIRALCQALQLGSVADVASGAFLKRRDPSKHERVCAQLRASSDLPDDVLASMNHWGTRSLDWAYRSLLDFRRQAWRLMEHNSGWLECGDPLLLGMIRITDEAAEPLRASLQPIDELLLELLDPDHRSFALTELVERYGYSDVDLRQLDTDWF